MTLTATRRTSLVLALALATFAWGAMLSATAWLGVPTATAAAQEADDLEPDDDGEEDGLGGLEDLAPEDDDAPEDEDGDGLEEDGFDDDGLDDGFDDDGFDDDDAEDATPLGGVDAGFGGLAGDGTNALAASIAIATLLLALGAGLWLQRQETGTTEAS